VLLNACNEREVEKIKGIEVGGIHGRGLALTHERRGKEWMKPQLRGDARKGRKETTDRAGHFILPYVEFTGVAGDKKSAAERIERGRGRGKGKEEQGAA